MSDSYFNFDNVKWKNIKYAKFDSLLSRIKWINTFVQSGLLDTDHTSHFYSYQIWNGKTYNFSVGWNVRRRRRWQRDIRRHRWQRGYTPPPPLTGGYTPQQQQYSQSIVTLLYFENNPLLFWVPDDTTPIISCHADWGTVRTRTW
jgi:hypothetical protein